MTAVAIVATTVAGSIRERVREEGVECRGHMLVHFEMLESIEARWR